MREVIKFLTKNHVFYIATLEGDQPRVRPFGFFMEYEGRLYFGVGDHKPSYAQLRVNPKFEISVADEDGSWIRITAGAVFDSRSETQDKAFETNPRLKTLYGKPDGAQLALFYADNARAVIVNPQTGTREFAF